MNEINLLENQRIAWKPSPEIVERARLTEFMRQVGAKTFDELYQFSIDDVERFTAQVLKFLDIKFDPPYKSILETSNGIEFPTWLDGAGLNITEMCLDRWQTDEMRDQPAIIWEGEEGKSRTLTYAELMSEVEICAASLRDFGITKGDAIVIHLPMITETIVALLAINRIGAIAVPVFSGYGVDAIASRINAVQAKAVFTCFGFYRRGKIYRAFDIAEEAIAKSPSIKKIFIVQQEGQLQDETVYNRHDNLWDYDSILENGETFGRNAIPEPTLAEDPLIILYTSGTTGKPKGIAHTHASFPIKAAQDMAFQMDVGKGTRISWITDIGWMMGPWLIYGALINGATICLYDGAPDYPNANRMWEFSAKHKVEILGISPTLIRSLATQGDDLPKKHDLSSLRAFASTGEPWNPAPWWWLFETVGDKQLPIINYSGGTEISGGILSNNFLLPIKPCGFSAPCLGMDVDVLDETCATVGKGEVGELVIKKPWIGMAHGFWGERERYLETYWSRFANVWVHGDWAMKDADENYFILGRSDDTLKVAGKRVGPAEVESLLVAHEAVAEAAVIGVPDEMKGTKMIAFVVLKNDATENLEAELKQTVAKDMGKPLAPSRIHFVSAIPKTRNAKIMRRVIRAAYLGENAGDLSALENPNTLNEIKLLNQ